MDSVFTDDFADPAGLLDDLRTAGAGLLQFIRAEGKDKEPEARSKADDNSG
ncbi:MAG: hypothetical protein IJ237_06500 [Oscillospiraceae bacterium]|nr:hypothetical protein [Oscillospiraceae bacterium]